MKHGDIHVSVFHEHFPESQSAQGLPMQPSSRPHVTEQQQVGITDGVRSDISKIFLKNLSSVDILPD